MIQFLLRFFTTGGIVILLFQFTRSAAQQTASLATTEGDFVAKDFKFRSGESLSELRLHYTTLGKPVRDAQGRVTNAVLVLHGTGGSGKQFLQPIFEGELFGPGQLLDATRYYIVLPDGIGHGKSSKPSDGMHAHFPQYDYDDMVLGHYRLLTEGLDVNHLRLLLGTSMGCMHSFVWGETYPDFMDALMPLACAPVQIAGRNRISRKMMIDAIRNDPEWRGGEYTTQPQQAMRTVLDLRLIGGSTPLYVYKTLPTRDAADKYLDDYMKAGVDGFDANNTLYAVNASRNYDPSPQLGKINAPVMYINSADDFVNPPELGIAEREIKKVKNGRFVLLPITDETRGHGTHTRAAVWKQYLAELLEKSAEVQSQQRRTNMGQPGRILGIGGIFFKSANQQQMKEWYAKHLGLADSGHGDVMLPWRERDHPESEQMTVWTIFPASTKYFEPSPAPFMLNYIVDDLEALLDRLAKEGVHIDPKRQDESYGRFAWIYDPDGNKIELWQPLNPNK